MATFFSLALTGVAAYGVLVAGLFLAQRRLLYHGTGERPDLALADAGDMAEVRLATADGLDLIAWYRPAVAGRPTIVHLHGNAGHIGHRAGKLGPLRDAGYGLLLVEYRGFGGNPGAPMEDGLYADGRAALAFLRAEATNIVLYGESLGSGVAVQLATEARVAGLVLEAPYTSIPDVAQGHYWYVPVRPLLRDRYESVAKIGRVRCPILVLHGEADRVVPIRFGRDLFAAANEPKSAWWSGAAAHDDLYDHGAAEALLEFLGRTFPVAAAGGVG
ncbi:MAG: alpha/beta hydrolase [Alphaproteobacteria bacterium]|nr:alpha/beta hydrolase [Alphaproteobacteria bacterium]